MCVKFVSNYKPRLFTLFASRGNDVEANVRVKRRRRPSDDALPAVRQEATLAVHFDFFFSQVATFGIPVCCRQRPIVWFDLEQTTNNYTALILLSKYKLIKFKLTQTNKLATLRTLLSIIEFFNPAPTINTIARQMNMANRSGYPFSSAPSHGCRILPRFLIDHSDIDRLDRESIIEDKAEAPDAVPIKYSRIRFQPMKKATNSPTVT